MAKSKKVQEVKLPEPQKDVSPIVTTYSTEEFDVRDGNTVIKLKRFGKNWSVEPCNGNGFFFLGYTNKKKIIKSLKVVELIELALRYALQETTEEDK